MSEQIIKKHQIISTNQLIRALTEGRKNSERFCFIIGSGASVSSGIPTGASLEYQWMEEMERDPGLEEIHEIANNLSDHLEYKFADIEKDWESAKKSGDSLSSEYYFDIYKLRFSPNHRNGYHYLENIMANKNPGFGYHPLALMLTDGTGSNLVITTNFDSLIEDALFLYTDSKPLVINHELLADYAGDSNIKRPIIAKVHRGIFFDPLNQPEEINELKGNWRDVLSSVFQNYTPIVIGYGGGDRSLMNLLEKNDIKMKNGIYWCYFEKYGLPNDKIQALVNSKNGYLVRTAGFDATMLAIGNAFFPDKIGPHAAEEYLNRRTNIQIENYEKEYSKLTERENPEEKVDIKDQKHQSETEFKEEIEKIVKRSHDSEKERQESNRMTAWDYWRKADQYYERKQYEEAINCYSDAIHIQSNIATFYNNRGLAYSCLEKYDAAILDLSKAIELDPENSNAYNNRGYVFSYLEKYDAAILDLHKAIELNPKNEMAYNNLGYIYIALEDYDRAAADLNKAIKLNPKLENAYKNMGILWKNKADFNKAVEFLTKAIELNPEYKEAYIERAKVYGLMGESAKAAADEAHAAEL